ncbi:chemotaxis protein CheW [Hippea maritima]|uniref:CheW protein n=1 Tax=Hippea maritima (strain ATCC 700847 / DSM 10411 / MH2) TaxID=760142 RepID=F2LTK5_HIPMA|nr:chemotaxis protein CheW [Hippea maritima]AEA33330.1 CheW protein [Hippea maritima DSM 10411]
MTAQNVDLFDKSLALNEDLEEEIAKKSQKSNAIIMKDEYEQVVGFILNQELFGVDILDVEEIIKPVDYTFVPNTKPFVLGVINLRGKIIPIVDLRVKFSFKIKPISADTRIIIISHEEYNVGFVVDKIEKVYYIEKKNIEPTPPNIPPSIEKYVKGVGKMPKNIITLLNIEELLHEGGSLYSKSLSKPAEVENG